MRRISDSQRPPVLDIEVGDAWSLDGGGARADVIRIHDYFPMFYKRRWLILALLVLGGLAAAAYNWRSISIYEGRARLLIDGDANILGLDRPVVDQRFGWRDFQPTQLGILQSRSLARRAREEMVKGNPRLPYPPAESIQKGLLLNPEKESRIVSIGFQSANPEVAARVANAVADAYVKQSLELRAQTAGEASAWLTEQVAQQRKLVAASEAALQRYRQEHGADVLGDRKNGEQPSIVVQKLAELQEAVTRARSETIEKETQAAQLSAIAASQQSLDTLPAIASNSFIQSLKAELLRLQQQLAQTSEKLGERHPEIIKLRAATDNADRKVRAEIEKVAASIRIDRDAARARERALAAALERQKSAVTELNAKGVEYTALEREAEANRQQLDNLLQRSREAVLARDVPGNSARVLDAADVPEFPVLPRKTRNLALGVFAGGVFAIGLVFVLEIFNTRMTSPDDVTRHLHLRVLGVAPQVKPQTGDGALLLSDHASAQYTELLHGVRTSLVFAPELSTSRTLLVTSSQPGEGKTVAAANLAVSLARLNQRVLLIDADLRRPRLHDVFGFHQQPGLTDVLRGKASQGAVRKTKVPRLWLMPSGIPSRQAADLLGSERFRQLIECFREQFDWIVLDSPPVLSVTDACLITRVASGVLFVVGSGQTSRKIARAAVERLDAVGANLVGVLLNRADVDGDADAYLPFYHRDYQYYSADVTSWSPDVPSVSGTSDTTGKVSPQIQAESS
jgi:capsular exopolysaccharide synthesis family protein